VPSSWRPYIYFCTEHNAYCALNFDSLCIWVNYIYIVCRTTLHLQVQWVLPALHFFFHTQTMGAPLS